MADPGCAWIGLHLCGKPSFLLAAVQFALVVASPSSTTCKFGVAGATSLHSGEVREVDAAVLLQTANGQPRHKVADSAAMDDDNSNTSYTWKSDPAPAHSAVVADSRVSASATDVSQPSPLPTLSTWMNLSFQEAGGKHKISTDGADLKLGNTSGGSLLSLTAVEKMRWAYTPEISVMPFLAVFTVFVTCCLAASQVCMAASESASHSVPKQKCSADAARMFARGASKEVAAAASRTHNSHLASLPGMSLGSKRFVPQQQQAASLSYAAFVGPSGSSSWVRPKLASVVRVPPTSSEGLPKGPLCPALVLAKREGHLNIPVAALLGTAACGEASIFGPLGKVWGRAVVRQEAGGKVLDLRVAYPSGEDQVARVIDRSAGKLEIFGPTGARHALLTRRDSTTYDVRSSPADAAPLASITGDPGALWLTATAGDGRPLASMSHAVQRSIGPDSLEVRIQCGADTALLVSCMFGIVIFLG